LLWVSLLYTRSNQRPSELDELMTAFDQVLPGSQQGGTRKRDMLLARRIPDLVKFLNQDINKIFTELNDMFAVRYKPAPTDGELRAYELLRNLTELNTDSELRAYESLRNLLPDSPNDPSIQSQPAHSYSQSTQRLRTSRFVLQTLRDIVRDRSSWPEADRAQPQPFTTKRKNDQDKSDRGKNSGPSTSSKRSKFGSGRGHRRTSMVKQL
jgi:hypothetical protein